MSKRIIPLIMCGGAGTRLWPASREVRPKQFLPLFGVRSTFQDTILRVSDPTLFERPIVITNAAYRFMVLEQLAEIGCEADVLLEPMRRDSGPAIAAGAAFAQMRDGEATVLALAAGLLLLPHPRERTPAAVRTPRWDLAARAAVATCLVVALAALAPTIGARLTGLLAVYPLYSAVLAAFAHRLQGQAAALGLLRGLLVGLFSFTAFYAVLGALLARTGTATAFGSAVAAALLVQAGSLWPLRRLARSRSEATLSAWERSTRASTRSSAPGSSGSTSSS